jgi:hypothetical protein
VAGDGSYTAIVRGAELAFPRGGRWMFFAYFAIFCVVITLEGRISGLYAVVVLLGAAFSAGTFTLVFSRNGSRKFQADASGITVAEWTLPWSDIAQLRITRMGNGARLEVLLTPAAPVSYRSPLRQAADLVTMGYHSFFPRRQYWPSVRVPRPDPPRYLIPLLHVTPPELASGLAQVTPGTPIVVT